VATDKPRIVEIGVFLNAGTASSIQLIRPSNTPVASTSVLGQAEEVSDPAGTCNVDTAWSTAPTISAPPLRRVLFPATAGAGLIWTFPQGLTIPVSGWIVLWNFGAGAGSALSVYFVWDE
jgi:hypothetical protein